VRAVELVDAVCPAMIKPDNRLVIKATIGVAKAFLVPPLRHGLLAPTARLAVDAAFPGDVPFVGHPNLWAVTRFQPASAFACPVKTSSVGQMSSVGKATQRATLVAAFGPVPALDTSAGGPRLPTARPLANANTIVPRCRGRNAMMRTAKEVLCAAFNERHCDMRMHLTPDGMAPAAIEISVGAISTNIAGSVGFCGVPGIPGIQPLTKWVLPPEIIKIVDSERKLVPFMGQALQLNDQITVNLGADTDVEPTMWCVECALSMGVTTHYCFVLFSFVLCLWDIR
jgi:hypothetical protein